jgi:hypothetical protein
VLFRSSIAPESSGRWDKRKREYCEASPFQMRTVITFDGTSSRSLFPATWIDSIG